MSLRILYFERFALNMLGRVGNAYPDIENVVPQVLTYVQSTSCIRYTPCSHQSWLEEWKLHSREDYFSLIRDNSIVVLDCYFSYKWPPNQAQRANNSIRTYRYLRKHFPEIPYRRLNLHTFPCFYTLDLYITYTAYTIIHHGQQITPTWNLTWLPMEWKWWKRTPITQRKYDRTNVNTVSVEDILVVVWREIQNRKILCHMPSYWVGWSGRLEGWNERETTPRKRLRDRVRKWRSTAVQRKSTLNLGQVIWRRKSSR